MRKNSLGVMIHLFLFYNDTTTSYINYRNVIFKRYINRLYPEKVIIF